MIKDVTNIIYNKKGGNLISWILVPLFVISLIIFRVYLSEQSSNDNLITGSSTDDYALQSIYNEKTGQEQEDYYQQQIEEELQRQHEQKQYEEMLMEQQREEYEELRRQQEEEYQKSSSCYYGYTNEYKCSEDWSQRKYQYSNCSHVWVSYESCQYGCGEDGKCLQISLCIVGLKCKDPNYKGYQRTDCSWDFLDYCIHGCSEGICNSEQQSSEITVSYVIDGDTIRLSNGKTVRLIGLNAPESGQPCSSEATNTLREFVLGKQITLEEDVDDKDQYGRLLRYVYVDRTFINLELVRLGLAHKYEYGSNTKYSSQFEQAENEAKQNDSCLWQTSEEDYIQERCISITNLHYNAYGNDNYNLNDEYVTFRNSCSYPINMDDWTVKDNTASHIYYFPEFSVESGNAVTLYTGSGTNTFTIDGHKLYWGRTSGEYAAIWNNNGDTLFLRNKNGNLVLSQSY